MNMFEYIFMLFFLFCYSAILTKGNKFYDFLFTSLDKESLPKWGLLIKEKIAHMSNFVSFMGLT